MAVKQRLRGAGRIKTHSLQRSLAQLSIKVVKEDAARAKNLMQSGLAEGEQQFQIDLNGTASSNATWRDDVYLNFTEALFCLPGERDNDAIEPQMWFGYVLDSPTPVFISVCVMEWNMDGNESFTGARVAVGAFALGGDVDFRGRIHVTFQGYGAPLTDESE